jgi:hypothetical protein
VFGRWIIEVGVSGVWIVEMGHRIVETGMRIRCPRDETVDIVFVQGLAIDLDVQAPFECVVQLEVGPLIPGTRSPRRQVKMTVSKEE